MSAARLEKNAWLPLPLREEAVGRGRSEVATDLRSSTGRSPLPLTPSHEGRGKNCDFATDAPSPLPQPSAPNPIVIAAGGTGGHFFPAEALAAEQAAKAAAALAAAAAPAS